MAPTNLLPPPGMLRQEWAMYITRLPEMIGDPCEYWGHLTYPQGESLPPHHQTEIANRRFRYFVRMLNERLYGKRWMRQGDSVWGAVATEGHLSGYPHHHFVMGGVGLRKTLRRLDIKDIWSNLFADKKNGYAIARVWDYPGEAAGRYVSKYVAKGSQLDIFYGRNVRDRINPKP